MGALIADVWKALIARLRRGSPAEALPPRAPSARTDIVDDRPLTHRNQPPEPDLGRDLRELEEVGLRASPYPFADVVSVVSDCDKLDRRDYLAYRTLLVDDLGLDFGDSFKLHQWTTTEAAAGLRGRPVGYDAPDPLAFFACNGTPAPRVSADADPGETLGFGELLREYHGGNLDHLHAVSYAGPRLVRLSPAGRSGAAASTFVPGDLETHETRPFDFIADTVPVRLVAAVPKATGPPPVGAEVTLKGGEAIRLVPLPMLEEGWRPALSADGPPPVLFQMPPGRMREPPVLRDVDRVELVGPPGGAACPAVSVFVGNVARPHLLAMLADLHGRFGVRTNLVTDHASKWFVNRSSEARHAEANAERVGRSPRPALYGQVKRRDLYYSCLGDDPESVAYILPDLRDRFGIRFINPSGTSGEPAPAGFELFGAVVPARLRDGSTLYVARRARAGLPADVPENLRRDQGTRSFPLRLRWFLDRARGERPAAWPLYTHLGNLTPKGDRSDPYFPREVFHGLQDCVFGMSGAVSAARRIWFTRASVLYDYCLMLRSLSGHLKRFGPDRIHVGSWHDPVLGRCVPESVNQLHGLTVYVEDPWRARLWLDGDEVPFLVRNGPDDTGRPSVTVLGFGPEHLVLDDWDFLGPGAACRGVDYRWCVDPPGAYRGCCYARLALRQDGVGEVVYRPRHLRPWGSQYLVYALRPAAEGMHFGMVVETVTGGRFYVGDPRAAPQEPLTAGYQCVPAAPGHWATRAVPFYDLDWAEGAGPGGPVPSHPVRAMRFRLAGPAGGVVDLDRVAFVRPGTLSPGGGRTGYVVGGQVAGGGRRAEVTLSYEARGERVTRRRTVREPEGLFVFPGVPAGSIVTLEGRADGRPLRPRRGRRFDLWCHDMTVVLEPVAWPDCST